MTTEAHNCACSPAEEAACGCKSKQASDAVMCVCDHNPQGECHCPPFESKCDQKHHLATKA